MLDDGTEVPDDDEILFETSRFAMLYSLRCEDDGRFSVDAFDRWGRRVRDHALLGLVFDAPRDAYDAIRRAEAGSGEMPLAEPVAAIDVEGEPAARSA